MKKYEVLNLEVLSIGESDIISTSVVIGGDKPGSETSWGEIGGGQINE